jgi:TRAP-type C4-dicarboxylate transport system substrate-binding protein
MQIPRTHTLKLLALCLFALALTGTARAETTLKIATVVPDGTAWMATMRNGAKEIEERTGGRVKFKIYGGGVQGNDSQVMRKMRVGQLHGGVFTSGALRAFQKDAEIYGLPRLFRNYGEVAYVRERMDDEIYRRLDQAGYVTFGYAGGGFALLASRSPVRSREDLRQVKMWIPEGDQVARLATEALGVSPVSLPVTDVLTGLQTELIDTVMGPPVGMIVMQWQTAVSYVSELPLAYIYAGLLIDKRYWSKIAPEDQLIVSEVMSGIYQGFNEDGVADDEAALLALQAEGLEFVALSDAEVQSWDSLFQQANEQAAAEGAFDVGLLTELECHLEAYRTQTDDTCS